MKKPQKLKNSEAARKLEIHVEEKFKKDREKIERFKSEHRRFMAAVYTIILHVKMFLQKNTEDNINALSGQSAFFIILSAVPLLMLILSVIALLGGKSHEAALELAKVENGVSSTAAELAQKSGVSENIYQFILDAYANATSGIVVITAVTALWSAGKGLYIITDGISRIYRLPQKHLWLFRRIFAMGYTIVLLLMLALCFGVLFLDLTVSQYVEDIVKDLPVFVVILLGLRNILATVIIALFMTGALKLYLRRKVEDKRYTKFRVLLPGMIFTSISWNLLGRGVSLYTKYFTSSMYGNLGAVFIAMMWIYFMMLLLLYGVQINYVYREQFYLFSFKKVFSAIRRRLIKKKKTDTKAASQ